MTEVITITGGSKGEAYNYSDAAKGEPPKPYIQKSFDDERRLFNLKETDIYVSWFLHNGNTQIHIAIANFKRADFDVVILPLNKDMIGINIFKQEWGYRHYGKLFSGQLLEGEIKTCDKTGLACKETVAAVFSENGKSLIDVLMKSQINKKQRKNNVQTMGIPIELSIKLYDPMDFIWSIMTQRDIDNTGSFSCFLCFKGEESSLVSFIKNVDFFLRTKERTRRSVFSSAFKDIFPPLNVETEMISRGILETECECLVAAIGGDFNLDNGKLTQAIAKEAGKKLQVDINQLDKKEYQIGDVIHCRSRKLHTKGVKSILFGLLTKWKQSDDKKSMVKKVSNFVKECLLTADDNGCKSVVFPALGSGFLNYPEEVISAGLSRGINKYAEYGMKGNVSKVVISYLGNRKETLYKKLESSIIRCSNMKTGPMQSDNVTPNYQDDMNDMTNETMELVYDEVTGEVNPGITEYLKANNQRGNFETSLRKQFNIVTEDNNGKLVLKGSLTNMLETEKYLDTEFTHVFTPNHTGTEQQSATSKPEQTGVQPPTTADTCAQKGNDSECLAEITESSSQALATANKHVTKGRVVKPFTPPGVDPKLFCECDRDICVFKTDNIFSFETDIKVFITDEEFKYKNHLLSQMLERISEDHKDLLAEADETKRDMKVCQLKYPNTCTCVIAVVVPSVHAPIQKKEDIEKNLKII